jgi:hypothetical protein
VVPDRSCGAGSLARVVCYVVGLIGSDFSLHGLPVSVLHH